MSVSLRFVAVLLTAQLCLAGSEMSHEFADCLPEIPPEIGTNSTMVVLQMHQWIRIENLTSPEWAPRNEYGRMFYEQVRPGIVIEQTLHLVSGQGSVNISFVTNGDTLCTAAFTEYRNGTSGDLDRIGCTRICHSNFTSLRTRANLLLSVHENWAAMTRHSVSLGFDAVDPDSRAAYKCMGYFTEQGMRNVTGLLDQELNCAEGDECLFNYDTRLGHASAGCKGNFSSLSWCVSDMDLCEYQFNIWGECPVCCRGDFCNRQVAQKAYQRWLAGTTTERPRDASTTKAASTAASSLRMLEVSALSLFWLLLSRW